MAPLSAEPGKIANRARALRRTRAARGLCRGVALLALLEQADVRSSRTQRLVDPVGIGTSAGGRLRPSSPCRPGAAGTRSPATPAPQVVEEFGLHIRRNALDDSSRCCCLRWRERFSQVRKSDPVLEPRVHLVGLGLLLRGPLPRVLQGERRGDHDHLAGASEALGLEDDLRASRGSIGRRASRLPIRVSRGPGRPPAAAPRPPRRGAGALGGGAAGRGWDWPPWSEGRAEGAVGQGAPSERAGAAPSARCSCACGSGAANAPSSSSSWLPAETLHISGDSTKRKRATSPRPSEVICRITAARLVRRVPGSVNRTSSKSALEYRRMPAVGTRPQRPFRGQPGPADRLVGEPLHLRVHRVARDPRDALSTT